MCHGLLDVLYLYSFEPLKRRKTIIGNTVVYSGKKNQVTAPSFMEDVDMFVIGLSLT